MEEENNKKKRYSPIWDLINNRPFWEPKKRIKTAHKTIRKTSASYKGKFTWRNLTYWKTEEWKELKRLVKERYDLGYNIYPSHKLETIFRALLLTKFEDVKIVILGQDPYYTKGMADGLAFSVRPNVKKIPWTLRNIFTEYREDLGFKYPLTGSLLPWTKRGILLINTVWTVEEGKPRSHYRIGSKKRWQNLTANIIEELSRRRDKLVFILWGNVAQEWEYMIHDKEKHLILKGAHPSPRNRTWTGGPGKARFNGGKYFSKACEFLEEPYDIWRLP